jgi:hypothetical protein
VNVLQDVQGWTVDVGMPGDNFKLYSAVSGKIRIVLVIFSFPVYIAVIDFPADLARLYTSKLQVSQATPLFPEHR